MIISIKSSNASMKISTLGAEVRSVVTDGREHAWQNETGEWSGCAPLLFPCPGKNRLVFGGKDYGLSMHGFAQSKEFTLVEERGDSVLLSLIADSETREIYPFDFEFSVRYTLAESGYCVEYIITNRGTGDMPFSCGGHESFALEGEPEEYYVEFEKEENLDFHIHGDLGMLTGETVPHGHSRRLDIEKSFTDHGNTVILKNIKSEYAELRRRSDGSLVARTIFPGIVNLLIWHPHGSRMLCLEPWQSLPSYVGEIKEFSEREGVRVLAPGKSASIVRKIEYR